MPVDGVDLTIAIPTYGRAESLARTLQGLAGCLRADPSGVEVLVVDQTEPPVAESAQLCEILGNRYRQLRVGPPSLPAARNVALAHARGDIVVFLDDDVTVQEGLLAGYRAAFEDPTVGAVGGRVRAAGMPTSPQPYTLRPYGAARGGFDVDEAGTAYTAQGCNMALRRDAVRAIGGFDTVYIGNALREETDVCCRLRRAGWAIRYTPDAQVVHVQEPAGGCRTAGALSEQPEFYHNEVVFALRHRSLLWAAPLLAYMFVHHVLDPDAIRGGRAPQRARAYARGVARGIRHALRPPPQVHARPRHGG